MTAVTACRTCGTEPVENARFCHGCGSPVAQGDTHAEYKQVTVLFADVVQSMSIAAAVGAERLREIMTELVDRAMAVVQRYGATVDQFTGDGIMAVFGAPVALEDHAYAPVWLPWRSSGRSRVWLQKSIGGMASAFECGWAYAFHHPLIRAVAYESQLKSDRAEWHRRLAAVIKAGDPGSVDENAALIAQHLEAAGDVREAYRWHMRAGAWSTRRDISAARASWERARQIADALPDTDLDRTAMRIATRAKLCGSAWRGVRANVAGLVEELRELCKPVGDNTSLAIGLTALALQHGFHGQMREAIQLALEQMALLESIGDPTSTIGAASAAAWILNEAGQSAETLRWAQNVIEWAGGESVIRDSPVRPSPLIALALVFRGVARWRLGHDGREKTSMALLR